MEQLIGGAIGGGIAVYLIQWLFGKYTKKADTSEIKIVALEGSVAGVSDKAFAAINTVEVKIDAFKELFLTHIKRLDEKLDDIKTTRSKA